MVGTYTKFRGLEEADKKVFEESMEGLFGVKYEPLIVATQNDAGTRYKFICNATSVMNSSKEFTAEVAIFQPLPTKGVYSVITSISEIN